MHCHSCVLLTESELKGVKGIVQAKTSLQEKQVEVTGEFENKTREQIMNELNEVLKPHGYSLSLEKAGASMNWSEFFYALPLSVLFMAVFILLQKIGIVNLIQTGDVTYGTAFIVGLVASVSTCMAVVGGIVLSLSANYAKEGDTVRPQTMFHVSRLVSFFFLGGLIGILGSIFQLGATGALILGLIVALVLLILGINLLDMFPWMKKLQLTVPTSLGSRVHELKKNTPPSHTHSSRRSNLLSSLRLYTVHANLHPHNQQLLKRRIDHASVCLRNTARTRAFEL